MTIELTGELEELIVLQEVADETQAEVDRVHGALRTLPNLTDEQNRAWRDVWEDARVPWEELEDALTYHAETNGLDRDELRAAVRRAVGHAGTSAAG
ncbi:hypothetical protein ACIQUQ_03510 [Streptomyces sp. NPDC101118]|uniref:hypothetical protein n=1 Tax=Streptomyces sp. NPDC101118 TaxID=3366109 RepID=UPI003802B4FE